MAGLTGIRLLEGVSLGLLNNEHAPDMYRWMCDPVISENIGLRNKPSLDGTVQWIERARTDVSIRAFAIYFYGRHVGNVIIDRIEAYLGEGRLSVYLGDERGRGVGLTGMYLAIRTVFGSLPLNKIYLTVHARNFRALSAYAKLGFVLEGVLRESFIMRGERISALYMGLLRRDFERLETE